MAYHSSFINEDISICNIALLPLRTTFKGPATKDADLKYDVIDEALYYFKANIFLKNFPIQSNADRVLIYLMLYVSECLKKMQKCLNKNQAFQEMHMLSNSTFSIPGDPDFPLNPVYAKPKNRIDEENLRGYFLQLRQETGMRLIEKVFENANCKPSKWWMCFCRRKFLDKSLAAPGE
ncbi:unnamed protein product [Gordionus sp. m RMFG-2023]|uniref:actin-related protein 2/3 complex subunit 3-like isoform X2 n=1 Tax=Gordionus sp. m RMFG-2023 TaxID=3053472 RepID=UPI0030E05EBB